MEIEVNTPYTRLISGNDRLFIEATDGLGTFSSSGIFVGGIYNYSGVSLGVLGQARGPVEVTVYEQTVQGDLSQIFGNHGELLLTEHQVVEFVKNHSKWLRGRISIPFFIGSQKLVAFVSFVSRFNLCLNVVSFSFGEILSADHSRLVFLKQEPLTLVCLGSS